MEKIITSFLPQGQSWRLDTQKGYWFIASVDGGAFPMETNFDDMSQQERFIKHTFGVNVPAYFFVTQTPGAPVPIKRYVSSPIISFDVKSFSPTEVGGSEQQNHYVLGSDDPTLPLDEQKNVRKDQRAGGWRTQKIYPIYGEEELTSTSQVYAEDPAISNPNIPRSARGQNGQNFVKVINTSPSGEVVYSGASLGDLEIIVTKI